VGEWLDSALQFFAVVDIILTAIIIADSNLGGYIIIILCLVMIIFAWILVFTAIFNNYYHSELKNNLKEYLRQKYLLPIRQIRLAPQFYYCQNCGTLLDFIHEDRCSKCGGAIIKCVICGDVLQTASGKYDKVDGKSVDPQDRLAQLAKKMERKLNKDDSDVIGELACPECGVFAHVDEFYSWVQLHGTCPSCKKKISFGTNAGPEA
nr:hypothetical protein [Candidatus Sigynarchaeota archaeon]